MDRLVRRGIAAAGEPPPLLRLCRPLPALILSMRRSSFLVRFILIGILLHIYVGLRLIPDMPVDATGRWLCALWLVLSIFLIPLGMARAHDQDSSRSATGSHGSACWRWASSRRCWC